MAEPAVAERLRFARGRQFVGREAKLELVRSALEEPEPAVAVGFVHGPGGVGKRARSCAPWKTRHTTPARAPRGSTSTRCDRRRCALARSRGLRALRARVHDHIVARLDDPGVDCEEVIAVAQLDGEAAGQHE